MSMNDILKEVKSLEEALKCKVCDKLLKDPLLIIKCGHTTCKNCLSKHEDMTCPVCEIPVNTKDSLEDKQLRDLLNHLSELKTVLEEGVITPEINDTPKAIQAKEIQNKIHCSTPISSKLRNSSKTSTKRNSNGKGEIVQKTPECKNKTPVVDSNGRRKSSLNKKSNPNMSMQTIQSPSNNINKKNHKGETPLHQAVIKGDISKVMNLLNQGATVNTQDNNGWTPLHEASNHGFTEIAKLLLDHGALVNVPSLKDNITPLHDALLNDKTDIAVLLASRGADLHAKSSFGYTALDLCKTDEIRRTLTEACSPFIDANTIIPDPKTADGNNNKIVFLQSNLNDDQKIKLEKCANFLKATIVDEFKSEVTHIVTSCDNMGNCTRTMKILLGMLSGKWLMNYQWIEVCLEYKRKVEEEVFEVQGTKNQPNTQGPTRARKNFEQKFPPLFDGFYFYLHGTFVKPTPLREDLCNLIHLGGGKLLSREPKAETIAAETYLIPYHAAGTPLEQISHIILFQDKPPRGVHINSDHIGTTQVMWLISCISEFSLLELKQTDLNDK